MTSFDSYLTYAHSARRRAMYYSVAAGALAGAFAGIIGFTFTTAAVACVVVTGLIEIFVASQYQEPRRRANRAIVTLQPRHLVVGVLLSATALLSILLLDPPRREALAFARRLQQASARPEDPKNIHEAKQILASATAARIEIASPVLRGAGNQFVSARDSDPGGWDAAMAFIDYRSHFAGPVVSMRDFYPLGTPLDSKFELTYYGVSRVRGMAPPQFTTSLKRVSIESSARLEPLGGPVKQTAHEGPVILLGVGGTMALDGSYLRNVVLQNVTVYYYGGPVVLDNVKFVDCRFQIRNVPPGKKLTAQILASLAVSFRSQDSPS